MDLPDIKRVKVPGELLAEVRDEWVAHGLSTEPVDRAAVETTVAAMYRKAKVPPPATVVWLGSPFAGVLGSYFLDVELYGRGGEPDVPDWGPNTAGAIGGVSGLHPAGDTWVTFHAGGGSLDEQVQAQVRPTWNMITHRVFQQLEDTEDWHAFGDRVEDQVRAVAADRLGARSLRESWTGEPLAVRDRIRRQDSTAIDSQRDGGRLAEHDINRRRGKRGDPRLPGVMRMAGSAGRWWPMADAVVLTERPTELHRDVQRRPHRADGPAIRYPDGWCVYAWHGVLVPADLIEGEGWSTDRIRAESNSVLRRCAQDHRTARRDGSARVDSAQ